MNVASKSEIGILILISLCFLDICRAQQCNGGGRFGNGCKFQCHCAGNTACDPSNGDCSNGCDPKWFGPACQYDVSEFTVTDGSESDLSWLTDNNDTTCNNGNVQSITARLNTPHPLTWVRVVVKDTAYLNQFQLSYLSDDSQNSTHCVNPRSARVDDVTLDISCPTLVVVSHVTLSGANVLGLCSFYISGGRNVVFEETAQQSTTFDTYWYAYKAVDGNPGLEGSSRDTCSHTIPYEGGLAWWKVTFSNSVVINGFVIYNRNGQCCRHRLVNFTLQAFPSSGTNPVYSYTDQGGPAQLVYTVVPSPPIDLPVKSVRFDVSRNNDRQNIVTLCEVYVFGEVVCSPGEFGRKCERTCNCNNQTEDCFVSTGGCPSGCAAGYTGEDCYTQCSAGSYGKDCDGTCSEHCAEDANLCNYVNGTCDQGCDPGYLMPLCEDKCPIRKYGQDCAKMCNATCLNSECHHVTGKCNDCPKGYTGVFCEQECPHATYGSRCNQNCSMNCLNQTCDSTDGKCIECIDTWRGDFCDAEEQSSEGDDGGGGALIPAIVGAVVAVVVITAVIVGILCWRRRSGAKHESRDGSMIEPTVETGNANSNPALDTGEPERPSRQSKLRYVNFAKAQEVDDGEESEEDKESESSENPYTNILTDDTSVPVEDLKAYLHQHSTDSHFKDEFMAIPMDLGQDQNHGVAARNSKKNRYKNIIPYDTNRVLLEVDEKRKLADYINASYVKGYNDCETFIASQGPNDAILNDFVRMLWEQNIDRVVMLTHLVELGKIKCTMYWPEDGDKTFGEIKMHLLTTQVFSEYTIRHLRLCKGDESPRDVTQFHFTAWPDKSVPENPWGLVDFQQRVMAEPGPGRLLVHCSAGVGRTGTFIALCNLLKEAEATGKMDFRSTLHKLRQDRMHMIQTVAQYTFLHKAALVGHMTSGTNIRVKDISAKFQSLEGGASTDKSARTYQQEFDDLAAVCDEDTIMPHKQSDGAEHVNGNEKVLANKGKDRLSNILPNNTYRPILATEVKNEDDYINAVLVPNIKRNSQDILTQLPLPTTVTDFWRLVTQFKVGLVVAFDVDCRDTDESIGDFLPESDNNPLKNGRFEISSTTVSENSAFKEMSLSVQKKGIKGPSTSNGQHDLTCLLCKNSTLDPGSILEIINKIKDCRSSETCRTVYMCRNGAEHCGLVCIQSILLDRLEVDQCLTVPLVVGAIKAIRPQVIPTVDQYKCLYRVLKLSYDATNVYGNV